MGNYFWTPGTKLSGRILAFTRRDGQTHRYNPHNTPRSFPRAFGSSFPFLQSPSVFSGGKKIRSELGPEIMDLAIFNEKSWYPQNWQWTNSQTSWYSWSRFPLLSRRRVSDETRHANNWYKIPLLSELSESQESGNHQYKTSISVSEYTRLGRTALQQSGLPYTAPFAIL